MYKTVSFKKKLLATLVASSALGLSSIAFAQDDAEEIVVTGIKASLQRAVDIKRDAAGVVDAISFIYDIRSLLLNRLCYFN